jgi:hypothetical protein
LEPKTSKGVPRSQSKRFEKKIDRAMQKCGHRIKKIYWDF